MQTDRFLYTYVRQTDDHDLCRLEMRALFGQDTTANYLFSGRCIDPERSPFMKERLDVLAAADSIEEIIRFAATLPDDGTTFQIRCLNTMALGETEKIPHPERRRIERSIGLKMAAAADLFSPDLLYGVVRIGDTFLFGSLTENTAGWRNHIKKPEMYSTALSTHVARAVANIAVPHPEGVRAIDPCCGIGNVLVEARSMDIDMTGRDINPLAVLGSRKNLEHFGLTGTVDVGPIEEAAGHYDAAVIDMPYNLYTHATREQQASILKAARPLTDKLVLVTIENMDDLLADAGFTITDRCIARKAHFEREVVVCE
ncbi:TRM11 family SAM-dependent methyltransferase [Sporosarcina trichiuri]|uniref:TRM11 family SAM-dependent methyltransferase n=1 Tax=Sporosarcina trichiuri TaxID=3056445 RepID=UPI0025B3A437|nr:RNA methyltransferase [Sporosarcina sp. 0.2-SM1T-5]WJY28948.1 RNA methyltransferase [Sporosarcina sp. 0.2-SM1T-5]